MVHHVYMTMNKNNLRSLKLSILMYYNVYVFLYITME